MVTRHVESVAYLF